MVHSGEGKRFTGKEMSPIHALRSREGHHKWRLKICSHDPDSEVEE